MDELQKYIDGLVSERQSLAEKIKRIDKAVAYLRGEEPDKKQLIVRVPRITETKTVEFLIIQVLQRAAKPLHYKDILARLEIEEGHKVGGKNPIGTLTAHLSNSEKIIRTDKGMYGLAEWSSNSKDEKGESGANH